MVPPRIRNHHYNAQEVYLAVQCAFAGSTGFRPIARIFEIIKNCYDGSFVDPCYSSIRSWVLRIGVYKLECTKSNGEWMFIVDTSIQMGAMKALIVLGVRRETIEKNKDCTLSHDDVECLALRTVESCTGEIVDEALKEAEQKTGIPFAFLTDKGSEQIRGVKLYNADGKQKCDSPS